MRKTIYSSKMGQRPFRHSIGIMWSGAKVQHSLFDLLASGLSHQLGERSLSLLAAACSRLHLLYSSSPRLHRRGEGSPAARVLATTVDGVCGGGNKRFQQRLKKKPLLPPLIQ